MVWPTGIKIKREIKSNRNLKLQLNKSNIESRNWPQPTDMEKLYDKIKNKSSLLYKKCVHLICYVTRVPERSEQEPMNSKEIGCVYSVHNMEFGTLNASIICNTGVAFAFKLQIFRFIIKRKHWRILKDGNKKIKVQTFLFSLFPGKKTHTHTCCLHPSLWFEIDLNIVH